MNKKPEGKQISADGLRTVRCGDCHRVLGEKDEMYWNKAPEKMGCQKCKNDACYHTSIWNFQKPSKVIHRYWCNFCREEFDRTVPSDRKYCPDCKQFFIFSFGLLLNLPYGPNSLAA